jgi:hypothetical protein
VQQVSRGAHGLAVDLDEGQPRRVEEHEGIEEVEEHRGVAHQSGFLDA